MTIKKPSSFSHYLTAASYRQRASGTQLYHIARRKPLALGHHMLHKKDYCSSRGKLKLHSHFALLLFYGASLGNSSAGQSAGLQSKW